MSDKRTYALSLYRRFVRLGFKWPINEERLGRDYGEHINRSFRAKFRENREISEPKEIDRLIVDGYLKLQSLQRILADTYRHKYQRPVEFGYSNVTSPEKFGTLLSTKNQTSTKKGGFLQRLFSR
eukprot:Sdes_comp19023_c0_seq1m9578